MSVDDFSQILIDHDIIVDLNNHSTITLNSLSEFLHDKRTINFARPQIKNLIRLIQYDFSEYNIIERLNLLKEISKDSTSLKSHILRFGEEEGKIRYDERIKNLTYKSSKSSYVEKYGEEEATRLLKLKCPNNIDTLKLKYPNNWEEKLDAYMVNYKKSNCPEHYIEIYGEEEGIKKYTDIQQRKRLTLDNFIIKHGEVIGKMMYEDKRSKQSYRSSKQYYVDTYGEKDGEKIFKYYTITECTKRKLGDDYESWYEKINERRRRPVKIKFIEKYGEEEGLKFYENYVSSLKRAHTLEYHIEKYGEIEGTIKYADFRKEISQRFRNAKSGVSYISLNLFIELESKLNEQCEYRNVEQNKKEFFIRSDTRAFFYDFRYKNKIIEFNGDFWHMNPLKYNEFDLNTVNHKTAKEIWDLDDIKLNFAKSNGYDVYVLWEQYYKSNKIEATEECMNFLTN